MFRFLSLFRRNKDEQLNDNDYDLVERSDTPGVDIVESNMATSDAGKERPSLDSGTGGGPENSALTSRLRDALDSGQEASALRELAGMSGNNGTRSGEDQTDSESQEGESFFNVTGKELLGKGGENFVYDIPDDPSMVGRVAIEPLIEQLAQTEGLPNNEEATATDTLQAKLEAENVTYDELCTYFGKENVPHTTRDVSRVPVDENFLRAIYATKQRRMPDVTIAPSTMLTIVAMQEKVPQIKDENSLDVQGGLAEARTRSVMDKEEYQEAYKAATQALVCNPESASFDLDQFLVIHPDLEKIITQAKTNPELKASLTDFVQKAMQYSKETGKSLDLNGAKNILFFENIDDNTENSWRYKLVDATSPYAEAALRKTKELMEKVIADEPIEDHVDRHLLRSAVNYQRTLNGLAKQLGIEDHLDMIPHASTIAPDKFWEILYDGGPPESSSQKQEQEQVAA